MAKYQCAVVEISKGKFEVTIPGDVMSYREPQGSITSYFIIEGRPVANPLTGMESRSGKYAAFPHIRVDGGDNVETVEDFRGQVAKVIEQCTKGIENRVPELTTDVSAALRQNGYDVRPSGERTTIPRKYMPEDLHRKFGKNY